jgi:hypothetical protein
MRAIVGDPIQGVYVYGRRRTTVEQINTEGHVLYLHRDQQGSTRLLTESTVKAEATFAYGPYGTLTGTTTLGYLSPCRPRCSQTCVARRARSSKTAAHVGGRS